MAACFWKDSGMIAYASDPDKDVHRDQAMRLFKVGKEVATEGRKNVRDWAKNRFVFPILYGSYHVSCARHIWEAVEGGGKLPDGTTARKWLTGKGIGSPAAYEQHVKGVEDAFMRQFPTFAERKERWWNQYVRRGWFRLPTGFVVQGVYGRNFLMNCPIQGSGFHCLLWSLIRIMKVLRKRRMRSLIIGEIHDCIIFDAPEDELQDLLALAKEVMTEDLRKAWPWVCVPMGVEVDVSDTTWHGKQPWVEHGGKWGPK